MTKNSTEFKIKVVKAYQNNEGQIFVEEIQRLKYFFNVKKNTYKPIFWIIMIFEKRVLVFPNNKLYLFKFYAIKKRSKILF